jgi:radical SAM superfamily enzyme YgiQ (UPF0313 family)
MAAKILLLKLSDPAQYVTTPPLGIGYIASYLKNNGNLVDFIDFGNDHICDDDFGGILRKKSYDYIGIQLYSYHLNLAKKYTEIIKKNLPFSIVVVGGPHPSSEPEHTLNYLHNVDYAIRSEGEKPFASLVNSGINPSIEQLKNISNLVYRYENIVHVNPVKLEDNLDVFSMPDWELINPHKYALAPQGIFVKKKPVAPISITRGCPYKCTYCAGFAVMGRKIRKRSINNVFSEIKYLYDKYGVREIHVIDDNFTFYRPVVIEFCEKIINENLKIYWACPNGVRVDSLDKELLQLMEKSGCVSFGLGIESGSERILKKMKKHLKPEIVKEKVDLIKECTSISTTGFFLMGYSEEDRNDILRTINFAKSIKIDMAAFAIIQPLPGTDLFNSWMAKNKINLDAIDWDKFFHIGVFEGISELTEKELRQLQKKAVREFYLRPHIIFGIIKRIKTFTQLKTIIKRVISIFLNK